MNKTFRINEQIERKFIINKHKFRINYHKFRWNLYVIRIRNNKKTLQIIRINKYITLKNCTLMNTYKKIIITYWKRN